MNIYKVDKEDLKKYILKFRDTYFHSSVKKCVYESFTLSKTYNCNV